MHWFSWGEGGGGHTFIGRVMVATIISLIPVTGNYSCRHHCHRALTIAGVLPLLLSRQRETAQPEERKEDQAHPEEPGTIRPEILEQERCLSQGSARQEADPGGLGREGS